MRSLAVVVALVVSACSIASTADAPKSSCSQVAVIGDSMTAHSAEALRREIPGVIVNARGGRFASQAWDAAEGINSSNPKVDCWVFALGTNDLFASSDPAWGWADSIDALLDVPAADDRVWWVLPRADDPDQFNEADFAALIPDNVIVLDPINEFGRDGVHLTEDGYVQRAKAIARAVSS